MGGVFGSISKSSDKVLEPPLNPLLKKAETLNVVDKFYDLLLRLFISLQDHPKRQ
jgi:hypothetical protein